MNTEKTLEIANRLASRNDNLSEVELTNYLSYSRIERTKEEVLCMFKSFIHIHTYFRDGVLRIQGIPVNPNRSVHLTSNSAEIILKRVSVQPVYEFGWDIENVFMYTIQIKLLNFK